MDVRIATEEQGARSLAALVEEFSALLYRVALSIVRRPEEAEDVVQETFLRVLQRESELSQIREMKPWLVRIAWNLALDRKRRVRPEQMDEVFAVSLVGSEVPADEALHRARELNTVLAQVDLLPKLERQVLLLSSVEEFSHAEIAVVLSRSESSVRSLMFRARTHLQERMRALESRRGA